MSDVIELIVCDKDGVFTESQRGKIVPASGDDENIYTFYAVKDESTKSEIKKVQLTMPVGGEQNGVLRLPKIGERILVIVQGNSYYLLSYLPNKSDMEFRQNIEEKDEQGNKKTYKEESFVDNEAFSIRYKSPNPLPESVHSATCGSNIYSELKFSTQETSWPTKVIVSKNSNGKWIDSNNYEYMEDVVKKITDKNGVVSHTDKIDNVELLSTGDLYTSAGNFNAMAGRRIALISGDEKAITVSGIDNLKQGDITGKAGHKIYLEAQDEIVLKCGRSEIRMNDAGISIVSAKIDPQYGIADDSRIFLDPRTGITIKGSNVNINANTRYSISERCGGNISSFAGMTRICARDVQVASQNVIDAGITFASSIYEYAVMGEAIDNAYTNKQEGIEETSNFRKLLGKAGIGVKGGLTGIWKICKFSQDSTLNSRLEKVLKCNLTNDHVRMDLEDIKNLSNQEKEQYVKVSKCSMDKSVVKKEWLKMYGSKNPTDEEKAQAEKFAERYIAKRNADKSKTQRDGNKKFINGSQAVSVAVADMALSIANTLIKVTDLTFAIIEQQHKDIVANKGAKHGKNGDDWTGSDLRDRCNKGYYWATQTIVEALNGACFVVDIAKGVLGARIQTGLDTSSIRFHGGYGDITCSSVEEKGIQFINGTSPTASSIMSTIGTVSAITGAGLDISTAVFKGLTNGFNKEEEELKYL